MKQIKLILLLLILLANTLFAKSWEMEPNREYIYSTNSGVKLKVVAGISDSNKKLCFLIKKEDNSKFYYSGTMYLEFANGHRELAIYSGNKTTDKVSKCIKFDRENVTGYAIPYSVLAQGTVKVWVEASNGDYFPFPDFYLKASDPIKIKDYSITKVSETDDYEKFKMTLSLSRIPTVVKIETDTGRTYYFLKKGWVQLKPDFIEKWDYSSDKKSWTIYFKIKKQEYIQNKWFKLIVQDYRAKSANELVDSRKEYFTIKTLNTSSYSSNNTEKDKNIDFKKMCVGDTLEIFKNCNKKPFVLDFSSGYYDFSIRVVPTESLPSNYSIKAKSTNIFPTWQTLSWNRFSDYKININSKDIKDIDLLKFEVAIFDSNDEVVQSKSISIQIKHYQSQTEIENNTDFDKLFKFFKKSGLISKLDLENKTILYHHFTRAEAALILYEFLKLKNSNFKLPYNINLYENPFADVNKDVDYYEAIITLANFKGSDNITVLTKEFGHFNPLENVTRFQFVKMIIEGLNIDKTNDLSYIQNYDDYSQLGEDAKIYYATAVKEGIIKGDNNKLLPYNKLTIFQALTILQRVLDFNFYPSKDQFIEPVLDDLQIGNPLGSINEIQEFAINVTPIKIYDIFVSNYDKCKKLSVNSQLDSKASESYEWSANFGYFIQLPNQTNNKEVLFCPATKMPNNDYVVKVVGTDGLLNFDEKSVTISRYDFEYKKNISDINPEEIKQNISISKKSSILKENSSFIFNLSGNLYKDNLKIGLEKVSVLLEANGIKYSINDVKWDNNYISFVVPSVKEFYGKNVSIKLNYATNYKHETKYFSAKYEPIYSISGMVEPDKNGDYPKYVRVNYTRVEVDIFGKFNYIAKNSGNFKIEIDRNYESVNISLSDKIPYKEVYLKYIDRDYDNDGVENDKDAFPYDPAISVDRDGDGYPDSYNSGYSDSIIPIDKYPNDPNKSSDDSKNEDDNRFNNEIVLVANNTEPLEQTIPAKFKFVIVSNEKIKALAIKTDKGDHFIKYDLGGEDIISRYGKIEVEIFNYNNWIVKYFIDKIEGGKNKEEIRFKFIIFDYDTTETLAEAEKTTILIDNRDNSENQICTQVITHAYDPKTGQEKDFPTPCDVPDDWVVGYLPDPETSGAIDLDSDILALSQYLYSTKSFQMAGIFAQFDFENVDKAFDWVFVTPNGDVYQLQGNKPTENNLFGWKKVGDGYEVSYEYFKDWLPGQYEKVVFDENSWIMVKLDDWDDDGNGKFDWLLFKNLNNEGDFTDVIYKLDGVTESGNFRYKKIDGMEVYKQNGEYVFYYKDYSSPMP